MAGPEADAAARDSARRRRSGRVKMLLLLALFVAPVVASYYTYYVIRPEGRTNYGTLIQPSRALPSALPLTTLDGQRVEAASLHGRWLLLAVGGGACAADCEKRLYMQRQLREMLGRERDRVEKIWLVDDTVPLRPELRAAVDAAPPVTVLRVERAALTQWLAPADGHRLDEHLYVVDPMGEWMMRMPAEPDPARVKRDLEQLLRASAGWDRPAR